jgi:integrase
MAEIKFIIRNLKTKKETPIVLLYHLERGDKLLFPTGQKVFPKHWSVTNERVKDVIEATEKDKTNFALAELKKAFTTELTRMRAKGEPIVKDVLRDWLNSYMKPPEQKKDVSFHGYFKDFLNRANSKINLKSGKPVVYTTVRKYYQCYNELLDYEKKHNVILTWDKIDLEFYQNFIELLQSKNQTVNNIGKHIKTLKSVMNEATDNNINTNLKFKSPRFKSISENAEDIFLNEVELKHLYSLDLTNNPKLDKVRDLFLIGCWTGLRLSDYKCINPDAITGDFKNGNKQIEIEQQKTGSKVIIPVHPVIENILKKYDGKLPPAPSDQKFNQYIKEVAHSAGFTDTIIIRQNKGGKRLEIEMQKFEAVSSHTARRSFATNMFQRGIPTLTIMAITGHQSDRTFKQYVKVTPKGHADKMREQWAKNGDYLQVVNS